MVLQKEIYLSVLASRQIGSDGYKKLKFNTYYGDDFIKPGTNIPDDWNMVIVKMNGCIPALVPRSRIHEYAGMMIDLHGEKYFWGKTEPQVFEIKDYK